MGRHPWSICRNDVFSDVLKTRAKMIGRFERDDPHAGHINAQRKKGFGVKGLRAIGGDDHLYLADDQARHWA